MSMLMIFLLIILLFFYFLAWVYNGFETGILSLDKLKLENEAKKSKKAKRILDFYENIEKPLGTVLIGNNISNVIIVTISTFIFVELLSFGNTYSTVLITITFLVFCMILPKSLFRDYPITLVYTFFPLVYISYIVLKPLVKIVSFINLQMKKIFKLGDNNPYMAFTKDDLEFILLKTFEEGEIEKPQKEMLEEALDFTNLIAKNIMVPRIEIIGIPDTMTYPEIIKFASVEGYTRYPVYHETLDEITGVLIIYDLLKIKNNNITAKEIQREMFFVPGSMDVNVLLKEMQSNKKSIAVVVDAFGGTSGIVTIEDILEEIVGEIEDEYDVEEIKDIQKVGENTWIVNGFVKVVDLNEELNITMPEGEYETIAGLLINQLAKIPTKGMKIQINNCKFEIVEVTNKKVKKVKITLN